jgi:uncharacterized protein (DUF983 family)
VRPIGPWWLALLAQRCPRCHIGPLFNYGTYNLPHLTDMPEACPVCGQHYEPEPGFYWGAMYISFTFAVPIVLVTGAVLYWFFGDPDTWVYVTAVTVIMLLLTPPSFRYARAVMLYAFGGVRFDKRYLEKNGAALRK